MTNNYLLEGTDYLAIQSEIANIIKKEGFTDSSTSIYDMEESTLENALEDLDTYGFLTSKKIVLIRNIDLLDEELYKTDINHLCKYLDNPSADNLLIICAKKLDNRKKYIKTLQKHLQHIEIKISCADFVKKEFSGYKLDTDALNLLLEYCQSDLTKLKSECDKLKNYKLEEKNVTKQDVIDLCFEKLGDPTNLTFAFSRSLAERNKKEALSKYHELLSYNIKPYEIVGLVASQFRIMCQVKILENQNQFIKSAEIASILNEKPYRITKTRELTALYTMKELLALIKALQAIDIQIKTTSTDPNDLIELFILNI